MAKGNILKEAIADAKAVREVALQNAKAALEEAFTPKLQNMLSAKLSEDMENDFYEEDIEEPEMLEDDDSIDEEIDLEEILNELELDEGKEADDEEVVDEGKDADDDDEQVEEAVGYPNHRADQVQKVHHNAEDVNLGLKENEEFDLDTLLKEINNLDEQTPTGTAGPRPYAPSKGQTTSNSRGMNRRGFKQTARGTKRAVGHKKPVTRAAVGNVMERPKVRGINKNTLQEFDSIKKELNEVKKVLHVKTKELNEVNLLNSKLLYVNRIFKANNLDDAQKLRVVETLDKADSIKEAKLIYETIKDTFNVAKSKKASKKITKTRTLKEGLGMASKAAGMSRTKKTAPKKAIISETDNMVNRFQKLANIKINE